MSKTNMMLTELENLQLLIKELNTKHQNSSAELKSLMAKPMVEAGLLAKTEQQHALLKNNFTELQGKFDDLSHEMAKLTKKHQEKTTECNTLQAQVQQLTNEKKELLAKNEISSQRAQTILERLAALDNEGQSANN